MAGGMKQDVCHHVPEPGECPQHAPGSVPMGPSPILGRLGKAASLAAMEKRG